MNCNVNLHSFTQYVPKHLMQETVLYGATCRNKSIAKPIEDQKIQWLTTQCRTSKHSCKAKSWVLQDAIKSSSPCVW